MMQRQFLTAAAFVCLLCGTSMAHRGEWVLGDWTPERPCAKRFSDAALEMWLRQANEFLTATVARKGTSVQVVRSYGTHKVYLESTGVPHYIKVVNAGTRVFRHYVAEQEHFEAIARHHQLLVGDRPYIDADEEGAFNHAFPEMTGVFLTLPEVSGETVGVRRPYGYYDVRLVRGTRLILIDSLILMLPGTRGEFAVPIAVVGSKIL